MSNDFFTRWSRRKLDLAEPASADPTEPTPAIGEHEDLTAADPASEEAMRTSGEMTQDEIDALPAPDALTPTSDMTAFLRKGVPAALRNRALHRMWLIDPEIRDYVGDARDYAWDWNTPGGVPVSGPIPASTDIRQMVRDIFGNDPADPREPPEATAVEAPSSGDPLETQPAAQPEVPVAATRLEGHSQSADEAFEAQLDVASAPATPPRQRLSRHGGALPS